jgi:glycosyltransferase involved in cell wall biosynthesis
MSDATPRTILMSADVVGGVWTYALDLARALAPAGTHVALAAMGGTITEEQRHEAERAGVTLFAAPWKLEWMDDPWDDVARAGDWLADLAARLRPDLVHLNHYAHGGLGWGAPVAMVGHSDVCSWFRAVHGCEAPPSWDRYRRAVAAGLAAADYVVAPTETLLGSLVRDYGPLARARVIHNGRDGALYRRAADKAQLVLAAGRMWDDAKNLAALETAAPLVSWPVVVAGSTEHPDGGARTPRAVRALGPCSAAEMAALYSRAAIYALPARYEPFGLSILEAALSGCALVLGDIPSLRELWDGAAAFVPPDDAARLAATIGRFIDDATARRDYARAARHRAADYSARRMAASYLEVYRALVAAHTEAACA